MKINNKVFLKIGQKVKYTAEAEGFYPDSGEITITDNDNIDISLNEKAYKLTIKGSSYILPFDAVSNPYNEGWLEEKAELYVEWGDGTSSFIPTDYIESDLTHSYPFDAEWQITIKSSKNVMPTSVKQYNKPLTNRLKLISVDSPLLPVVNQRYALFHTFEGNARLNTLCKDIFRYNPDAVYADYVLYSTEQLSKIDEDLFKYNTKLVSFTYAFYYNLRYTSIPENLLKYNTEAKHFDYAFSNLYQLRVIPENLFKYCTKAQNFNYTFNYAYPATLPDNLFKYNTEMSTAQFCFNGHSSWTEPLKANLKIFNNDIITERSKNKSNFLNLSNMFYSRTTTSVPSGYNPIIVDPLWNDWNITTHSIQETYYRYINSHLNNKIVYLLFPNGIDDLKTGDPVLYSTSSSMGTYSVHSISSYDAETETIEIDEGHVLPFKKSEIQPYSNIQIAVQGFDNMIGGTSYYEGSVANYDDIPPALGYRRQSQITLQISPEDADFTLTSPRYTANDNTITVRAGDVVTYTVSKEGYLPINGNKTAINVEAETIDCTLLPPLETKFVTDLTTAGILSYKTNGTFTKNTNYGYLTSNYSSLADYIYTNTPIVTDESGIWEGSFRIRLSSYSTSSGHIFSTYKSGTASADCKNGFLLGIKNGRIYMFVSGNGTSWNLAMGGYGNTTRISTGDIWFKFGYDGTEYYVDYSRDNVKKFEEVQNWTRDWSLVSDVKIPLEVMQYPVFGYAWRDNPPQYMYFYPETLRITANDTLIYQSIAPGVTLPIVSTNNTPISNEITVNWGDGTESIYKETTITVDLATHFYDQPGIYTITIKSSDNSLPIWLNKSANNSTITQYSGITTFMENVTEIQGCLLILSNLNYTFYSWTRLRKIPKDLLIAYRTISNLTYTFYLTALEEIPEGLLDHCVGLTTLNYTFYNTPLVNIPETIFKNNKNLTTLNSTFSYCPIEINPLTYLSVHLKDLRLSYLNEFTGWEKYNKANLDINAYIDEYLKVTNNFSYMLKNLDLTGVDLSKLVETPNVTAAQYLFSNATLPSIPENLFANKPDLIDVSYCFSNSRISSIPANLFANNTKLENVSGCFNNNSQLTSVANDLFINCPNLTNISYCFYQTAITNVPTSLVVDKPSLSNASYCFTRTAITSIPENAFSQSKNLQSVQYCFNTTPITNVPHGIFKDCKYLTSAAYCFYNCASLNTVGNEIFSGCTSLTNATYCFSGCTALQTIGTDMFKECTSITSLRDLFNGCTNLTALPDNIFKDLSALTTVWNLCRGCTNLATIPPKLFESCTRINDMESAFDGCLKLKVRADLFGDNLTAWLNNGTNCYLTRTFYRDSYTGTEAGTAPEIWTKSGTHVDCFGGAGNNTSSLTNYNSIDSGWK